MRVDPSGNDWWHWLVGGLLLVGTLAATVLTGGAAAGSIGALVHVFVTGAAIGGFTSATLGAVTSGLSYVNGVLTWDWEKASQGFMSGAINGVVSGALSAGASNIGNSLGSFGRALVQGIINVGINSMVIGMVVSESGKIPIE